VAVYNVDENLTPEKKSIDSNKYSFYVSCAGLSLGLGLVTAGLDYKTVSDRSKIQFQMITYSYSSTNSKNWRRSVP